MFVNKKYTVQIEVITPIHVGASSEKHYIKDLDFFYDKKSHKVIFFNHNNLINSAYSNAYINHLINADYQAIKNIVTRDNTFEGKRIKLYNDPGSNIKANIRNGLTGKPIIPGSSIKGAIRSVLFNHLRERNERTNEAVFGSLNNGNDFMRFIRISDAQFENIDIVTAKIFNLYQNQGEWQSGWKHERVGGTNRTFATNGFTTSFEVIAIGETTTFEVMLSDVLFDLFHNLKNNRLHNHNKKSQILHNNITTLFRVINKYTHKFIIKEISFFREFNQAENSERIIDNLQEYLLPLIDNSENPKSCLLRLASGSGFHSITGDWQRNDHISTISNPLNGKRYKSRRLVFFYNENDELELLPMGYVLLKLKEK